MLWTLCSSTSFCFPSSFLSDPKRLVDSGVGEWEVLEGQEASGAVLRPHQRAAAAPAAAASYPTEGGLRGSGGLLSSPTLLFVFFPFLWEVSSAATVSQKTCVMFFLVHCYWQGSLHLLTELAVTCELISQQTNWSESLQSETKAAAAGVQLFLMLSSQPCALDKARCSPCFSNTQTQKRCTSEQLQQLPHIYMSEVPK